MGWIGSANGLSTPRLCHVQDAGHAEHVVTVHRAVVADRRARLLRNLRGDRLQSLVRGSESLLHTGAAVLEVDVVTRTPTERVAGRVAVRPHDGGSALDVDRRQ